MKKVTVRGTASKQRQVINGEKARKPVVQSALSQGDSQTSKSGTAPLRRLRATELLQALAQLPMSEAEGNRILKDFAGEAVF